MDISHILSQAPMLYLMPLMLVFLFGAVSTMVFFGRAKRLGIISLVVFLVSGSLFAVLGISTYSKKHEESHEVLSSYGIMMDGRTAYNLLYATSRQHGLQEIAENKDGEVELYKLYIKNKHLTVFQQVDVEYVEIEPVQ